jgi:ankyrin repeat protein
MLLDTGKADINLRHSFGDTLLSVAAIKGNESIISLLFGNGDTDEKLRNDRGTTPLHWAAGMGHWGSVDLLLAIGKSLYQFQDSAWRGRDM